MKNLIAIIATTILFASCELPPADATPIPPDSISLTPAKVYLKVGANAVSPDPVAVAVANPGVGDLGTLTLSTWCQNSPSWLQATLDDSTAPTTLRLSFTTGAGTYTGDACVWVYSSAAGITRQRVEVYMRRVDPGVLISEVCPNLSSSAADEFVELYNSSASPVSLAEWKVSYRSAAGTSDAILYAFPAGAAIPAGGYYLLAGNGFSRVAPDARFASVSLGDAGGSLALIDADGTIIDSVGYGTATGKFIETLAAAAPGLGKSIGRYPADATDTMSNSADFKVFAAPTPKALNN